jgi:hypothetical protein
MYYSSDPRYEEKKFYKIVQVNLLSTLTDDSIFEMPRYFEEQTQLKIINQHLKVKSWTILLMKNVIRMLMKRSNFL